MRYIPGPDYLLAPSPLLQNTLRCERLMLGGDNIQGSMVSPLSFSRPKKPSNTPPTLKTASSPKNLLSSPSTLTRPGCRGITSPGGSTRFLPDLS